MLGMRIIVVPVNFGRDPHIAIDMRYGQLRCSLDCVHVIPNVRVPRLALKGNRVFREGHISFI
jgi:hypothetical protein